MKVMVLVKASKASEAGEMPSEQLLTEMGNFNQELVNSGVMLAGEGLHPSSKGKRVRFSGKDRTVVDGPFAETKELLAGFWLWNVASMDEAVAWVKRCPNPMQEECEIEIRQVFSADDFGDALTPQVREQEAAMRAPGAGLKAPRFEDAAELLVAGLNETYTFESRVKIPEHWHRFAPHLGNVPTQVGGKSYGVCWNFQPGVGFDYLTAVEVKDVGKLPRDFTSVRLSAGRYAVFTHEGHVSTLPATLDAIWTRWLPDSGVRLTGAPSFERYTEEFNPQSGRGGIEVWLPIER